MQDIFTFMEHHTTLSTALIVVLLLLIMVEFVRQKKGTNLVSPAQTTNLINHQNAVVVDIRNEEAFASGHIIDAISLPMNSLEKNLKKIEKFKSRPIVVVCGAGIEAQRASKLLEQQGWKTYVLNGGLKSWQADQLPLIK